MAKELVQRHEMNLTRSYAYAHHISDLPLLEFVDNPVAVNAHRKLRKIAMKNNWECISLIKKGF